MRSGVIDGNDVFKEDIIIRYEFRVGRVGYVRLRYHEISGQTSEVLVISGNSSLRGRDIETEDVRLCVYCLGFSRSYTLFYIKRISVTAVMRCAENDVYGTPVHRILRIYSRYRGGEHGIYRVFRSVVCYVQSVESHTRNRSLIYQQIRFVYKRGGNVTCRFQIAVRAAEFKRSRYFVCRDRSSRQLNVLRLRNGNHCAVQPVSKRHGFAVLRIIGTRLILRGYRIDI